MRAALLLFAACTRYPLPAVVSDPAVRESLELRPGAGASGLTSWEVEYAYSLSEERGACRLTTPRVFLSLRQSLPVAAADATPAQLAGLDVLADHENGHLRIDRAAAHDLAEALRSIPPLPTCEAVHAQAERAAEQVIVACRARNAEYDAETAHGTR